LKYRFMKNSKLDLTSLFPAIMLGSWLPWERHWTWRWIHDQRKGAPCQQVVIISLPFFVQ
jgi:hypothetical protein